MRCSTTNKNWPSLRHKHGAALNIGRAVRNAVTMLDISLDKLVDLVRLDAKHIVENVINHGQKIDLSATAGLLRVSCKRARVYQLKPTLAAANCWRGSRLACIDAADQTAGQSLASG